MLATLQVDAVFTLVGAGGNLGEREAPFPAVHRDWCRAPRLYFLYFLYFSIHSLARSALETAVVSLGGNVGGEPPTSIRLQSWSRLVAKGHLWPIASGMRLQASDLAAEYPQWFDSGLKICGRCYRRFGRVGPWNFTPSLSQIRTWHSRVIRLVPPHEGCRLPSRIGAPQIGGPNVSFLRPRTCHRIRLCARIACHNQTYSMTSSARARIVGGTSSGGTFLSFFLR